MPIVAESPPLIFGGSPTPIPTRTPSPRPPGVTPTPRPSSTLTPAPSPPVSTWASSFVVRHEQFINRVNTLSSCFKRADLSDFSDQDFFDHTQVAMQDQYIAQEKDIYCSMQGVRALTNTLRRLGEE